MRNSALTPSAEHKDPSLRTVPCGLDLQARVVTVESGGRKTRPLTRMVGSVDTEVAGFGVKRQRSRSEAPELENSPQKNQTAGLSPIRPRGSGFRFAWSWKVSSSPLRLGPAVPRCPSFVNAFISGPTLKLPSHSGRLGNVTAIFRLELGLSTDETDRIRSCRRIARVDLI
jgi:hypothetical protein